jgi:hypothetical protein
MSRGSVLQRDGVLRWAARICAVVSVLLFLNMIRLYFFVTRYQSNDDGHNVGPPSPSECDGGADGRCSRHEYTVQHWHDAVPYLWALVAAVALTAILLAWRGWRPGDLMAPRVMATVYVVLTAVVVAALLRPLGVGA